MKRYITIITGIIENKNIIPKLGSILLAVVLWAYISSSKSGDVRFKLPVTFAGLQENYVVSKISNKFAVVIVRGNKDDLKNISSKNIKLLVDLSKAVPGELKSYAVQYQKIDFTDDLKIEVNPEEVKILTEKKITRDVKILPKFSGVPDKGFMTGKTRVIPEYVRISGPGSVINKIGVVYTDEIAVDNRNSTFQQEVRIARLDDEGLEYNLSGVNVNVNVMNYSELSTYEIPVIIKNKKKGFGYVFNSDRVKIKVIQSENKNINERSYAAYVDADEFVINNDEFKKKSKVDVMGFVHVNGDTLESDAGILSASPDTVEIVVTKDY